MRWMRAALGLGLAAWAACEDPTLYVGERPIAVDSGDEDERRGDDPTAEKPLDLDAGLPESESEPPPEPAPVEPPPPAPPPSTSPVPSLTPTRDASSSFLPPLGDGGIPFPGVGVTGIGLDWTTWPPRIRFQLSCRRDRDCELVRQGVCVDSRCVQCRTAFDCPGRGNTCTPDHVCVPQ